MKGHIQNSYKISHLLWSIISNFLFEYVVFLAFVSCDYPFCSFYKAIETMAHGKCQCIANQAVRRPGRIYIYIYIYYACTLTVFDNYGQNINQISTKNNKNWPSLWKGMSMFWKMFREKKGTSCIWGYQSILNEYS